ncbi:hypothetical protein QQ045_033152 [Rhodiola kirilowii]
MMIVGGVRLPWAAEVRFDVGFHWFEFGIGDDFTTLDDDSGRLATFLAAVGGYGVELVVVRFVDHEGAVLEEDWGVTEEEVDCAGDDAVAVVLTLGVGVEYVLVAVHSAVLEDGEVGLDSEGYCLVLSGPALFSNPMSLAMKKSPSTTTDQMLNT